MAQWPNQIWPPSAMIKIELFRFSVYMHMQYLYSDYLGCGEFISDIVLTILGDFDLERSWSRSFCATEDRGHNLAIVRRKNRFNRSKSTNSDMYNSFLILF